MLAHLLVHVIGRSISQKASGCVVKRITCEHCHEQYIYQLRRSATASEYALFHVGVAQKTQKAVNKAHAKLQRALAGGVDPIGCPMCGWLQAAMAKEKRKQAFKIIGLAVLIATVVLFFVWLMSELLEISEAALGTAAGICALIAFCAAAYVMVADVNRSAHRRTREALGARCRAMPSAEFDALLGENP